MFFLTFLLYFLPSSAVFSYGIGMNALLSRGDTVSFRIMKTMPRLVFCVAVSTAVLWCPTVFFLLPFGFFCFVPLCVFFLLFALRIGFAAVFPVEEDDGRRGVFEYLFMSGIVLLSLMEGVSFLDALVIALSCVCSFLLFLVLVVSVLERISVLSIPETRAGLPVYMVLLGVFSLFAFVFDAMWGAHPLL